jgi:hypothetical protein
MTIALIVFALFLVAVFFGTRKVEAIKLSKGIFDGLVIGPWVQGVNRSEGMIFMRCWTMTPRT